MAQLVGVQHMRGAQGGEVFKRMLTSEQEDTGRHTSHSKQPNPNPNPNQNLLYFTLYAQPTLLL